LTSSITVQLVLVTFRPLRYSFHCSISNPVKEDRVGFAEDVLQLFFGYIAINVYTIGN